MAVGSLTLSYTAVPIPNTAASNRLSHNAMIFPFMAFITEASFFKDLPGAIVQERIRYLLLLRILGIAFYNPTTQIFNEFQSTVQGKEGQAHFTKIPIHENAGDSPVGHRHFGLNFFFVIDSRQFLR